jgi:hypothetical protein
VFCLSYPGCAGLFHWISIICFVSQLFSCLSRLCFACFTGAVLLIQDVFCFTVVVLFFYYAFRLFHGCCFFLFWMCPMDRLDRQVSQSADYCGFLFFVHFLEIPIVKLTCSFILFSLTFWLNMRNLNVKHRIIQVAIRTPLNISNRFAWYLVYLHPIFYFLKHG